MTPHLNRSIVIIIPQKPFYDWMNYLDPEHPIHDLREHDSVLLPYEYSHDDAAKFIKENHVPIFDALLYSIWTDENDWPKKRSFNVFNEWFSWYFSTSIQDSVSNDPIRTELF